MQHKSRPVVNKLALLLLSIVVLELLLMTDRVHSVKVIKKKIMLKKLKKLLPLLALVKPKKKLILVPIPIPMFKNHGAYKHYQHHNYGGGGTAQPAHSMMMMQQPTLSAESSTLAPMSFMMIPNVGHPPPMDPSIGFDTVQPQVGAVGPNTTAASQPNPFAAMMLPSVMTMTIQSEPGGSSNIELSTSMTSNSPANTSAPLMLFQRPAQLQQQQTGSGSKWAPLQQQQLDYTSFHDEPAGGEQYYASPWATPSGALTRPQLASPAKLLRHEQVRAKQQQQQQAPIRQAGKLVASQQPHPNRKSPVVVLKAARARQNYASGRLTEKGGAQGEWRAVHPNGLELEDLVPVGPPQLIPVYQTANGQLHMSPPTEHTQSAQQQQMRRPVFSEMSNLEHEDSPVSLEHGSGGAEMHHTIGSATAMMRPTMMDNGSSSSSPTQPSMVAGTDAHNEAQSKSSHLSNNAMRAGSNNGDNSAGKTAGAELKGAPLQQKSRVSIAVSGGY